MRVFIILIILLANQQALTQIDLSSGLVAYYSFDGHAEDLSSNGNNASIIDDPILVEDCMGLSEGAYLFDGLSDYIEIEETEAIDFDWNDEFAISVWLKVPIEQASDVGGVADIIAKWDDISLSVPYSYAIRLTNQNDVFPGQITAIRFDSDGFGCHGGTKLFSDSAINDNKWHNVIFQRKADGMLEFYVDGILEDMILDQSMCSTINNNNILLGRRTISQPNHDRPFSGAIDELRIYNRPLNQEEIEFIVNKLVSSTTFTKRQSEFKIAPNPISENRFLIKDELNRSISGINLIGSNGEFLSQIRNNELPDLPVGIYFMEIIFLDRSRVIEKIMVLDSK